MKQFLQKNKTDLRFLYAILIAGFLLRVFSLNWDQGFHLHPDERAIVMYTLPLSFPKSVAEFFSPMSSWNPHFFAYGSFPLYLLHGLGNLFGLFDSRLSGYGSINLIGRLFSAIFDTGTIALIFLVGKKLFNKRVGQVASFLYAISVLPIQLSHFYAVDTILNFFILITLYFLLSFYEKSTIKKAVLIGTLFGFSLATKISAIVLLCSFGITIGIDFFLIAAYAPHKMRLWKPHLSPFLNHLLFFGTVICFTAVGTFFILEPYAFIDFKKFWLQNMQQQQMTKSAFTFPYTLQYVGKTPYLYEIKNMFFFGFGIPLGALCFTGMAFYLLSFLKEKRFFYKREELIFLSFFVVYFFIVGKFAIGFMRYMLPMYPFLCLCGAILLIQIFEILKKNIRNKVTLNTVYLILYTLLLIWPLSFLSIYTKTNTRVMATNWMLAHIPEQSVIAIEHWDDSLPLVEEQNYQMITLPLYDPDTSAKWQAINQKLAQTDYIILASNRLYIPLSKLTNCQTLPSSYCYPKTAAYYKKLFSGALGFKKIAEFTSYPTVPFTNIKIDDQKADESFTVYDHPKVIIFQKVHE